MQLSVAVTGVAGPDGTPAKPAGLVHIAVARLGHGSVFQEKHEFWTVRPGSCESGGGPRRPQARRKMPRELTFRNGEHRCQPNPTTPCSRRP